MIRDREKSSWDVVECGKDTGIIKFMERLCEYVCVYVRDFFLKSSER